MTVSADSTVVRVEHRFDASAERVYDAFLDPERAGKFMFATPTGQVVRCDIDARVGGSFTIVDRRGGEDVVHTGTYVTLQRPRLIVFTLLVEKYSSQTSKVTIEIAQLVKMAAARMTAQRELPMGAHDETAWTEEHVRAFEKFVKGQSQTLSLLKVAAERDENMLASMRK